MSFRAVKHHAQPKRLAISAAVAVALLSAYGSRRTYAGTCSGGAGTFTCSGVADFPNDSEQTLSAAGSPLTVTTTSGFGIDTSGNGNALSLSTDGSALSFTDVNSSLITAGQTGVSAQNNGTGSTSITTTGAVIGGTDGISAGNDVGAYDLTISTASVTGGNNGISAFNFGTGATSITSTGTVTGTSIDGIYARNYGKGTTGLTISAASVSGGDDGVFARNEGSDALSITTTGAVTGTSAVGIYARNYGTDLTINAAGVSGGYRGINAVNIGNGGSLSITTTGAVTGSKGDGIFATNSGVGSNLTINAASVSGARGVIARNYGSGTTSITSNGTVTGTNGYGILAKSYGTDLTINTNAVTASSIGIRAENRGKGATSVTSAGTVTSSSSVGIFASNYSYATSLTINAAATSGFDTGVVALNRGSGATNITITGTVSATTTNTGSYSKGNAPGAIYAGNDSNTTDLIIHTVAVEGNNIGIKARNQGTGITSISSTGSILTVLDGISAASYGATTGFTISTQDVEGGTNGINAKSYSGGAFSITTTGQVTGTNYYGIKARTASGSVTINTAAVTGGINGIGVKNFGKGATSITSSGSVTGNSGSGIRAHNYSSAGSLTISSAAASGGAYGIYAKNYGTGNTSITISGAATGGAYGAGVYNYSLNTSSISLSKGAAVSATSGTAITQSGKGAKTVTVNTGASVTGSIRSTGGVNTTTLNGGSLNVATGFALTVDGNLINSNGTINLQNAAVDALPATITGNYTGGGILRLDANFATDAADRLNITGNILAGGTRVSVNDISTGTATGTAITLISVGGTTVTGDFTLAAPVVNGAFNYNTLALVGQDWVLQSVAAGSGATGAPVYTPFAASFEALGQSLVTLAALPSFTARTQQTFATSNTTGANSGDETGVDSPVWFHINGGYRDIDSHRSTTGANFDTRHWNAQLGTDFTVADTSKGRFMTGVYVGYGQADTDVKSTAGKSKIDTTAYSLGLTGTWYGENGVYVDTQLQRSWYDSDLSASGVGAGKVNDIGGDGYSVSVEVGKEIALSDSLRITPQAQLMYAKVDTDRFTGANAEVVDIANSKSLRARLGTLLTKRFTEDGATTGFVIANVIREFEDETQVNVSGAQLSNSVDRWNGELGLGITHAWDKGTTHYALSARVTGTTSLNNVGDNQAAQGEVNFKVNF